MNFKDLLSLSFLSVISNKLRTVLSMLGIIIGVITIILVSAIGNGAKAQIEQQFKNLSVNTLMVFPMRGFELKLEDVDLIKTSSFVSKAAGFYQGNTSISSAGTTISTSVMGVDPGISDIVSISLDAGDMIGADMTKDKVVVLGNGILTQLFPDQKAQSVVGSTITINKKEFTIIGVLKKAGGGFGPISFDESIYVPTQTFEKYVVKRAPQLRVSAIAKDTPSVAKAVEDITKIINEKYKLESDSNQFRVIDAGGAVATAQANAATLTYLLIGMASIVFLVSGIGIMNVMFASVAERTKEIGILKSIGANQSSILWQFLLESLMLTCLGSLIGVTLGELIIGLNLVGDILPLLRSNGGDLMAVIFAMSTGLFFGRYPAWRASKLDPVDALRS